MSEANGRRETYAPKRKLLRPRRKPMHSVEQQTPLAVQSIFPLLYYSSPRASLLLWIKPSRERCTPRCKEMFCPPTYFLLDGISSYAAILTNSARESACIFCIT